MGVLLDVTSLISAEEFITAQNRDEPAEDPFAEQCFVEVIQSLVFQPSVWIAHPTLLRPAAKDFGPEPQLLQALIERNVIRPLQMNVPAETMATNEHQALTALRTDGMALLLSFVSSSCQADIDLQTETASEPFADRAAAWVNFQLRRHAAGHALRVGSPDGVEDNEFGRWARSASEASRDALAAMAGHHDPAYLLAFLARSLGYSTKARMGRLAYQPHPLRRDFTLSVGLAREGLENDRLRNVITAIRGIQGSLADAVGPSGAMRVELMAYELPLLGGRLWTRKEVGKQADRTWILRIADRIARYRDEAKELRRAIAGCTAPEDELRLRRDIAAVQVRLLQRLGLSPRTLEPLETALASEVGSVASTAAGIPNVAGVLVKAWSVRRNHARPDKPYQQFLYQEFLEGWKRAGD